jgi:hypothetical protein
MSAVVDLRSALIEGELVDVRAIAYAVLELADQVAELQARVFPPAPAPSDPAAVMAEPISVDKPQLGGS